MTHFYILTALELDLDVLPNISVLGLFNSLKDAQAMMHNYQQVLNPNYISNIKYLQSTNPSRITITSTPYSLYIEDSACEYSTNLQIHIKEIE